jgi:hypothetical protein
MLSEMNHQRVREIRKARHKNLLNFSTKVIKMKSNKLASAQPQMLPITKQLMLIMITLLKSSHGDKSS